MEPVTSTNIYFERRGEPFVGIKECLEACCEAGFTKLDFGFAELSLISDKFACEDWQSEILEYREFAAERNMKFVQAHATIFDFCNLTDDFQQKKEFFEKSIRGAALLFVPWIVVHPSTGSLHGRFDPDTHKKNVAFFQQYSEYAAGYGVGLAVENMWGMTKDGVPHYCIQAEELLQLLEGVNRENVKACWDVEHGSVEGLDQKKAIRLLDRYIVATHISDEAGKKNIHILPYMGNADWEVILRALADINYSGPFDLEIQHYLPGIPKNMVPAAMKFSFLVGTDLLCRLEKMKRENRYE